MAESTVAVSNGPRGNGDSEITRAREIHLRPPVDIYEIPNALFLVADMPGVSKDNLDVRIDENTLTIQGKAQHEARGEPIYREFELGSFFREFELSDEIDREKINAELRHGVLSLRLPKVEQPRQNGSKSS
jgi:HSP20 family protein